MKKKEKKQVDTPKGNRKNEAVVQPERGKELYEGRINAEPEVKPPTGRVDQPEGGNRQARQRRWM